MGEAKRMADMQNKLAVNIKVEDLKDVTCACGSTVFDTALQAKIIPALYSQNGKKSMLQQPCLKCVSCGAVYSIDAILQGD